MEKDFIDRDEILRYLGYKNQKIDNITDQLICDSINELILLAKERYVYKFFNISRDEDGVLLIESNLKLSGKDIKSHLNKSQVCVLIAVTLGHAVDTKIKYYEKTNITKAIILDACATVAIEETCNRVCEKIQAELIKDNKLLTFRYSPGYGDLPIDIQSDFLLTLGAKKSIGLTTSSHSILIPRKSVTAIAGVIDNKDYKEESSCINCTKYSTCIFSKGGIRCEY